MYINPADNKPVQPQYQQDYDAELKASKEQAQAILQDGSLSDQAKREEIYKIKRHLDEIYFHSSEKITLQQKTDYNLTSMDLGSIIFAFDHPEDEPTGPTAPSPMSVLSAVCAKKKID